MSSKDKSHAVIKPLPSRSYSFKQSSYSDVPGPLPASILITAPSNSGKTVLLQSMITDIWAQCFEAGVHIWSASINLDEAWKPVKVYMEQQGFDPKQYCHETFVESELLELMSEQKSVIEYQKRKNHKVLYQQLYVIDDMLDDKRLMRYSKQLEVLFARGRHMGITTIVSNQRYRALMPTARISNTDEILFANIRNAMDKKAWFEEQSALVPEDVMQEIYDRARKIPYAFIWIDRRAKDVNKLVHIGFNQPEKLE